MAAGDLPSVARVALAEGAAGLSRFSVRLFRPVLPMLAQTAEDAADAVSRLGRAALEFKLDGARVQLRSEEHTSELQSRSDLVCRLLLEKKKIFHTLIQSPAPLGRSTPSELYRSLVNAAQQSDE